MRDVQPTKVRSARAARLRWILLATVLLLPVAAGLAIRWRGERLRQAAIDRIAIEHEALTPAYLPAPKREGTLDPEEWLTRVARYRPTFDASDLSKGPRYDALLASARAGTLGDAARAAFEAFDHSLHAALDASAPTPELFESKRQAFWAELAEELRRCDGTRPWPDCATKALGVLAAGSLSGLELARQAARHGPIDPVAVASRLEQEGQALPALPFREESLLADAYHVAAVHRAQTERAREALDALRAGLACARVHGSPRSWIEQALHGVHVSRVLDGLQTILPLLPRDLDVADLEQALAGVRPRESAAQAVRGERAFGNRLFEATREGVVLRGSPIELPGHVLQGLHRQLVGGIDQAAYLNAMTELAGRVQQPFHSRPPARESVDQSFWTPWAGLVLPNYDSLLGSTDRLEARLVLARTALAAYHSGAQDALKLVSQSTDPFDGRPIRCAFGEDGVVVFWSVGQDGKDGGADPASDDIVWRLKLSDRARSGAR